MLPSPDDAQKLDNFDYKSINKVIFLVLATVSTVQILGRVTVPEALFKGHNALFGKYVIWFPASFGAFDDFPGLFI